MFDPHDSDTAPWPDDTTVQCVFCFEWVAISVDPQDRGSMVQDCDVCCRPMQITVHWTDEGQLSLRVDPAC